MKYTYKYILLLSFILLHAVNTAIYAVSNASNITVSDLNTKYSLNDNNDSTQKILIINSYHIGFEWSDMLTSAIQRNFNKYETDFEIYITNLDTLRVKNTQSSQNVIRSILKHYLNLHIDAIIVNDDGAYLGILEYLKENPLSIPIVFCGVSGYEPYDIKDYPNITGVVQSVNINPTIKLALNLFPNTKNIIYITDNSQIGSIYRTSVIPKLRSEYKSLNFHNINGSSITTYDMLKQVSIIPPDSIVILGVWLYDSSGTYFSQSKMYPKLIKNCNAPIFTNTDFGIEFGLAGGMIATADVQAESVVKQIVEILESNNKSIPPVIVPEQIAKLNYKTLKKWKINPKNIPNNALLINTPIPLPKPVVVLIWILSIVIAALSISLFAITIYIKRYKKVKNLQIQQSKESSAIMSSLPLWCGIIGSNGKILVSNSEYSGDLNYPITKNKEKIIEAVVNSVQNDRIIELEFDFEGKKYVGITKPLKDNIYEIPSSVFIVVDITEKARTSNLIKEKNNLLDIALSVGKSCYWSWNIKEQCIEVDSHFWECQGMHDNQKTKIDIDSFWKYVSKLDKHDAEFELHQILYKYQDSSSFEIKLQFSDIPQWFYARANILEKDLSGEVLRIGVFMSNITTMKEFEIELKDINDQLIDAQELAKIGNWQLFPDNNIGRASQGFFDIFNLPYPEKGLTNVETILAKLGNPEYFYNNIERLKVVGDHIEDTNTIIDQDGKTIKTISSTTRLTMDKNNNPIYIGVIQDITERMQLENELSSREQLLLQAANIAHICYWQYDADQKQIIIQNTRSIWGENHIDGILTLEDILSFTHPDDHQKMTQMFRQVVSGLRPTGNIYHKSIIHGQIKHMNNSWESFYNEDGSLESVLGIAIDVTDIKEREQKEIEQKEIEAAAKAKAQFLATMSHEIRTPINVVIGMTHLMQETCLDEIQHNFLHKIEHASSSLLKIVNDILDISKIEENKLTIENIEFSIADLMYNNASILAIGTEDNDVELHVKIEPGIPERLIGDPLRISQILTNLLSNSIKFTLHGDITISAEVFSRTDTVINICFKVTDTGIGIKQESIAKLFQPYIQAEKSTSRQFGGTGLGLNICKQLTELMGGTIKVESEVKKGTCFTVELPFEIPENQEPKSSNQIPELTGKNAIIADDNHTSLEIISEMVIDAGFNVTIAENGDEVIDILTNSEKIYDLAIIDWNMPKRNGIETALEIQESTQYKKPILIAVTSYNKDSVIQKCLNAGFVAVLNKPIIPQNLISQIRKAFNLSGYTQPAKKEKVIPELSKYKMLLVEDQELNQEIIINMLAKTGIQITTAQNGIEALEQFRQSEFDIILMDVEMPEMNGYQAANNIRNSNNDAAKIVPIIAMTAHVMPEDIENSINAGMNDHLSKPINPNLLYKILEKHLNNKNKEKSDKSIIDSLAKIPSINTIDGIKYAGGDKERFIKILEKMVTSTPSQLNELDKAAHEYDLETTSKLIHTLKGSMGNIGACDIKDNLNELENLLKEQNNINENTIERLDNYIDQINTLAKDLQSVIMPQQPDTAKDRLNDIQQFSD